MEAGCEHGSGGVKLMKKILEFLTLWFVIYLAITITGCGPECIEGHYEDVTIPGHNEQRLRMTFNGDMVMVPEYVPEHKEKQWVCDKYEEKQEGKEEKK